MRQLIAAQSGWGKSYVGQATVENNLEDVEYTAILDYKDEFKGLVKSGLASYVAVGDREAALSPQAWAQVFQRNRTVVLARAVDQDTWRQVVARVAASMRLLDGQGLVVVDEAHSVADQQSKLLEAIKLLATTGRGGVSSIWITQRLQELHNTVISQTNAALFGGFKSQSDRNRLGAEYNEAVHNPLADGPIYDLPEALHHPEDGPVPLRKREEAGQVVMSEWIYSDDSGTMHRKNSANIDMQSPHYGGSDHELRQPF
ncbi:HerA helicase [Halanaeroarchaeum sp. HSR-CO]|uniref:ATP-binding protein n=1 Tax=Halanaeroarchaeum sp. HSR-CO TaxID=2866382 RepID=UPI00217D4858|nr:ATP-binding protein [Halanaeroarchaeum sp. HSR-CO]UWG46582.1 HerA helicase [Halanaeroarchaeum sp. HSR-CO]